MTTKANIRNATINVLVAAAKDWQRGDIRKLDQECLRYLTADQTTKFRESINYEMDEPALGSCAAAALASPAY